MLQPLFLLSHLQINLYKTLKMFSYGLLLCVSLHVQLPSVWISLRLRMGLNR